MCVQIDPLKSQNQQIDHLEGADHLEDQVNQYLVHTVA